MDVRVVPSVRAMSAIRAADTTASSAIEAPPLMALTATIAPANSVRTSGFAAMPSRRPYRRRRGPASRTRNPMLTMFITAV
jgi:hypothetical protein